MSNRMTSRIPQSFIDDLLNRIDIVEIIDTRVPLKRSGREFTACCPFHEEKTPSFTVSPAKQFYHCFGCGTHGTAVGFLMDYEHMSFPDAIDELAHTMGMEVPREDAPQGTSQKTNYEDLYRLLEKADNFYRLQLRQHSTRSKAVDYLRQRGLSGECVAEFGIGYAPPGWNNLQHGLSDPELTPHKLMSAGLVIQNEEGNHYDRFRERIIFPIRDRRGRTIGFGGRVIGDATPKYLNSPETPLFHKGRELYGLHEARKALRDIPHLLVVEGYMDVLSLAQFDIRYAVATLGTATTREHLNQLFRITSKVVFCFDGDRAGREAAWRALENALPVMREGREIHFIFLPEGEDPDTRIRDLGKQAFEAEIEHATPFSEFFFSSLSNDINMDSIDGRARLVEQTKPLLARLSKGVYRKMMMDRLSELSRLAPNVLESAIEQGSTSINPPSGVKHYKPLAYGKQSKTPPTLVRSAIELLLQRPDLAPLAGDPQRFKELELAGITLLVDMLILLQESPHLGSSALLERWRDTENSRHLKKLAAKPCLVDEERLEPEFNGVLQRLDERCREYRAEVLLTKSRHGTLSSDEKIELKQLLER